jgi:2-amino-4-hydroxy-6-hydroxymethyldihydropteridine diphosphokinase
MSPGTAISSPTASSPALAEDGWLAVRFGHPVYTVLDPASLAPADLRERGTYQAKVPASRPDLVARLEDAGMRVVNASVTLGRGPAAIGPEPDTVRPLDPGADGALLDVAQRSFTQTRFHLDPGTPDAVANRIKRDWVESYLLGTRGEEMLVAEADGKPVGFLAVIRRGTTRVIDLIAVDPDHRDKGLGRDLVARFMSDSEATAERVQVGTQAANVRAIRFYERLGYVVDETAFDLHLHVS